MDAVLFVVPTKAIRSVAQEVAQYLKTKPIIIHASKGLEQGTHKRISEVIAEEIPAENGKGLWFYLVQAMQKKSLFMTLQPLQQQAKI